MLVRIRSGSGRRTGRGSRVRQYTDEVQQARLLKRSGTLKIEGTFLEVEFPSQEGILLGHLAMNALADTYERGLSRRPKASPPRPRRLNGTQECYPLSGRSRPG